MIDGVRGRVAVAVAGTALLAACGGDDGGNKSAGGGNKSASGSGSDCPDVLLSKQSGQTVYASDIKASGVSCAPARRGAREWGRQNTGGPDATLPKGWKCGS